MRFKVKAITISRITSVEEAKRFLDQWDDCIPITDDPLTNFYLELPDKPEEFNAHYNRLLAEINSVPAEDLFRIGDTVEFDDNDEWN